MHETLYTLPLKSLQGDITTLEPYRGSVLLVVNVASKCGLTDQYAGLERLYQTWRHQGFEVLGFPSNEFAGQEPGSDEEILAFCRGTFGVQFPMFSKITVNGEHRHPLYRELIAACPEAIPAPQGTLSARLAAKGLTPAHKQDIQWNFEKFLVGRDGCVLARFAPDVTPEDALILDALQRALAQ
ncbi:Vitamin B12 transport periplasmic protein [Sodalis praecaptivus]|uniref:Thioredoxin/glutathione peroxidase BtuE n=1 Tax=Sodalis praecaptivus TaxID=1239307 RepID=W0HTM6_9GAMM|nr:glutathione peroxidase [Sodalis praecaptivus]AHF77119.1 Vitamin B12 transport periplasmic protein [Sodalis praecaptivus]CAJ0993141.1 Thioredoxin/glutathione peroxidase BtuE [Sodalis praecaptivus]